MSEMAGLYGVDGPETAVSVFMEDGGVLDGEGYVIGLAKAERASTGEVAVEKESRQLGAEPGHVLYAEMRVAPEDLLYFFDVNVWHRRCVLVKALLVGGLGWQLEKDGKVVYDSTESREVPEDPAAQFLARPNPDALQPLDVVMNRFLVDYFALGNAYMEVVRDRAGRVAELYHAPARTMRRKKDFTGYVQVRGVEKAPFAAFGRPEEGRSEILHLYLYDPASDYYGMPDWYGALGAMALDRTVLEFNTHLFSNALMAHSAIIVEGGKLSQGARDAIKSFVLRRGTGVQNAGRVLLLEDERDSVRIKFEKLNLDVKDVMIVEAQRHFRDLVVSGHGVPPRVLGIVTPGQLGATGEVEGQLRTFLETVLRPGRREVETLFATLLQEFGEGYRLRLREMDVTDLKADGEFYAKMIERGVFTAEEVRGMFD